MWMCSCGALLPMSAMFRRGRLIQPTQDVGRRCDFLDQLGAIGPCQVDDLLDALAARHQQEPGKAPVVQQQHPAEREVADLGSRADQTLKQHEHGSGMAPVAVSRYPSGENPAVIPRGWTTARRGRWHEAHDPPAHARSVACARGPVRQERRLQRLLVHVLADRQRLSQEAARARTRRRFERS